jgi:hypothetical protein
MENYTPQTYLFRAIKVNKHSTIYEMIEGEEGSSFITKTVKIEKFQGFSHAYNLGEYFRIRNASNWKDSKQITGLWQTTREDIFYGDIKEGSVKTLLLFQYAQKRAYLKVYVYPKGFDPSRARTDSYARDIGSLEVSDSVDVND